MNTTICPDSNPPAQNNAPNMKQPVVETSNDLGVDINLVYVMAYSVTPNAIKKQGISQLPVTSSAYLSMSNVLLISGVGYVIIF